jgi:hypothetical protein
MARHEEVRWTIVGVGLRRDGHCRVVVTPGLAMKLLARLGRINNVSLSQRAHTTSGAARSVVHVQVMVTRDERGVCSADDSPALAWDGLLPRSQAGQRLAASKGETESTLYLLAFYFIVSNLHRATCKQLAPRVGRGFRVL